MEPENISIAHNKIIITSIKTELKNIKTFYFEYADNKQIKYKSGQFITLLSSDENNRRSYSLSTLPTDDFAGFTVKRIDNGLFSRRLIDQTCVGDQFKIIEPSGFFTIPDDINNYKTVYFFAAGIGITPIFSIIRYLLDTTTLNLNLIYSNKSIDQTLFYHELNDLLDKHPGRFIIQYLFSNAADLSRARLNKQAVHQALSGFSEKERRESLFFVCGPFSYMRMVIFGLEEQNIPLENIKKENFTVLPTHNYAQPKDIDTHVVQIKIGDSVYTFDTVFPDTILQSARKHGIQLPYSCETGQCGSCAAVCTSGQVWMSQNEVLTDRELQNGYILTCTGYAVGGDITIRL